MLRSTILQAVKSAATVTYPDPDYRFSHNGNRSASIGSDIVLARCEIGEVIILGRFLIEIHRYNITLGPRVNLKSKEMATFQLKCNKL